MKSLLSLSVKDMLVALGKVCLGAVMYAIVIATAIGIIYIFTVMPNMMRYVVSGTFVLAASYFAGNDLYKHFKKNEKEKRDE